MAPRKTTKTAVEAEPTPEPNNLEKIEALREQAVTIDVRGIAEDVFNLELRFQAALAVLPVVIRHGADQHLGGIIRDSDENEAGACARIAFEYADAFIAQSKKGQGDAG